MDPRLLSIHLEGNPRRDAFRQARARVEHVAGGHTLAGDVRLPLGSEAKALKTLAPGEVPVKPGGTHCWLLDRGKQIPLKVGLNSVGRLPDNDVVIDDATVSRRHCAIVVHSDLTIEVHDVASKNGTLVNGKKISGPTRLRDNDDIGLSDRHLTFLMFAGQATCAPIHSAINPSSDDHTLAG
ncbi:MAG TPA: FHA domain-containing protein [Gemmataceae bacterium]|nr:FHA domain-containing protein [Gemmataceae bacterium]